jgi:hypothetical protein
VRVGDVDHHLATQIAERGECSDGVAKAGGQHDGVGLGGSTGGGNGLYFRLAAATLATVARRDADLMAGAGGGIVPQPTFLVGADLQSGALVEVLPRFRSIEMDVYAVCPTRKHLAPKVRVLVDFLVAALKTKTWPD